jgi:hypothetical protein
MAKSALDQLQDQIDAIRQEAYAAGYAAAMQAIREFVARPAASAPTRERAVTPRAAPVAPGPAPASAAPRRGRRPTAAKVTRPVAKRPQRGTNALLIAEVLRAMPSGTARPAEIRKALQSDKGVAMAFTSIRHALGQLEGRGTAEQIADSKTWRHRGSAA